MRLFAALLIASAAIVAPAAAQIPAAPAASQITVGATVKDTSGGTVGTVASIDGGNVLLDTGKNKVAIPEASFGKTPEGPLLAMTRDRVDAAAEAANTAGREKLTAALVPGAEVRGTAGAVIGKVEKVEGDLVTLASAAGSAKVPVSGLALQADGLHFGMSEAEFTAAVEAAKTGSPS